jgi:hypothetical protein
MPFMQTAAKAERAGPADKVASEAVAPREEKVDTVPTVHAHRETEALEDMGDVVARVAMEAQVHQAARVEMGQLSQ